MLRDKDAIINAHRQLVRRLYERILELEENGKLQRELIAKLKHELQQQRIPLPDVSSSYKSQVPGIVYGHVEQRDCEGDHHQVRKLGETKGAEGRNGLTRYYDNGQPCRSV